MPSNRRWLRAQRPVGAPTLDTLRLDEAEIPTAAAGEMLLRTEYLSLDPYMRGRMSNQPNGAGVTNLGRVPKHPSWALGILGMPGFTGWAGLTLIGRPKPGETIVVAAPWARRSDRSASSSDAASSESQVAPTNARSPRPSSGSMRASITRRRDWPSGSRRPRPRVSTSTFENVGRAVFDAVLPLANTAARVPVCGLVSQYNATSLPEGPDRMSWLMGQILRKRITMRGFIIFDDFGDHYGEFATAMAEWLDARTITYREDVVDGLEQAPAAFIGLLRGENFGKHVVRVEEAGDS